MGMWSRPGQKPAEQPQQGRRFGRPAPKPADRPSPVEDGQGGRPEGFLKASPSRVSALRSKFGKRNG